MSSERIGPHTRAARARSRSGEGGFTLIELLVVVVILGVLIAIAIPLYLNYRKGAYLASAKVDLHTLQLEEESYAAANHTFGTALQLVTLNPKLRMSKGGFGSVAWSGPTGYCVAPLNRNGPADPSAPYAKYGYGFKTYYFDSTTGAISDVPCVAPSTGTPFDGHYVDDANVY